jgi:TonB-linked SusC/RagA family outer membrane protein
MKNNNYVHMLFLGGNYLRWSLILFMCILSNQVSAQQNSISGRVVDNAGMPLPGVNIVIKGTAKGVQTDFDGKFSINASSGDILAISFIGMNDASVVVGTKTNLSIILQAGSQTLDEVVVVGYGVQKQKDVTGAVVSVKPNDLGVMPQTNIAQSLQGRVAGLTIVNSGTSAEGNVSIRIRAQNSISASASPLIVLDGIQFEGFLSEINPNDIESLDVLKDASATAIYGAKAANGVILITTKKGAVGKTRISFDTNLGVTNIINRPDMMDATQFYNFRKIRIPGGVPSFQQAQYDKGVNTNWLDQTVNTGFRREYNLSFSGGSSDTKYYISTNGTLVDGVAKNDVYNRYTLRINLETKINSWLKFGTNTTLGYYDRPNDEANIDDAIKMIPLLQPYQDNGAILFNPNLDDLNLKNPLEPLNYLKEDVARSFLTTNFFQIDFPFIKGLSYKLITGYNFRSRLIEQYKSSANTLEGFQKGGVATVNNQYKQDWSLENIFTYKRNFGAHALNLTGVYSTREYIEKYHDITGVGFPSDNLTNYQFRLATTLTPSDTYVAQTSISQMFRLNYGYNSKYLLTATVRRDGFSAFGANNKYGIFPSVALGWNMNEESFLNDVKWLDTSKIRLTYGENGNQAIAPYTTLPTLSTQNYLDNNGLPLIGYYPNKLADPTLSWETTRQVNFGWDFSFLNRRVYGSFDVYSGNTFDSLLNKIIPEINGVGSIRQNIGKIKTNGVELALSTLNVKNKNFTWKTDLTFNSSRSKIVDIGLFDDNNNPLSNVANAWFVGQQINVIYSYAFDGIFQETDDILGSAQPTAKPGDARVLDYNKDGKITVDDRHIIGQKNPDYTVGMMNTMLYKNFTFSFLFNAVKGITRFSEYTNTFFSGSTNIRQREWWTPENKINTYPANRDDSNPFGLNYFGKTNDASYIRLSEISLGYSLPESFLDKIGVARLDLFCNVKNVFTLTNYIGLDPEISSDYGTPQVRTFVFGLRVSL